MAPLGYGCGCGCNRRPLGGWVETAVWRWLRNVIGAGPIAPFGGWMVFIGWSPRGFRVVASVEHDDFS